MRRDDRRPSTIIRDNRVHDIYDEIMHNLGDDIGNSVSRSYIYGKIHDKTGLCVKTIAHIINHTKRTKENASL